MSKTKRHENLYKSRPGTNSHDAVVPKAFGINAMHDLLSIMKVQNELLHNANKKLKDDPAFLRDKEKSFSYPTGKRNRK